MFTAKLILTISFQVENSAFKMGNPKFLFHLSKNQKLLGTNEGRRWCSFGFYFAFTYANKAQAIVCSPKPSFLYK